MLSRCGQHLAMRAPDYLFGIDVIDGKEYLIAGDEYTTSVYAMHRTTD